MTDLIQLLKETVKFEEHIRNDLNNSDETLVRMAFQQYTKSQYEKIKQQMQLKKAS